MAKIFISYARKDKDEVYPIVDELERNGFECWIDKNGIESGEQFKNVILDAIDACEVFLYMLSANTMSSEWCQKEYNYANGYKRIVPLLLKGAKENRRLMFDFTTMDCIDIYDSVQKEKLLRDLKKWCGESSPNEKKDSETYANAKKIASHEYVDLGLPSGTLWATCNVGATKPTEYGDYFAWGETEPKEVYADSTYKWFNADSKIFTKYNSEDGLKTLLPEDDAATANWGSEWRMPTNEEQRELVEECQYQMTEVNGVYGAKFTGKNGNSVFFPAAGGRVGTGLVSVGYFGVYWSYSLREKDEDYARNLGIGEKNVYWGEGDRGKGYSVRAVANKTTDIEEYVVSFYTQDSVLIESQKVEKGKSATAVDAPVVDGYEFIGWSDSSFINVTKDLDIYAQYKAITKDTLPVSGQIAGYDYIDLGLPSGILWATYNVGATKPTEYGDYFAWGETKPKEDYSWSTYKWKEGPFTKYCTDSGYGTVDNKTVLEAEDDAVTANWGSAWRMPTRAEQEELREGCDWEWVEDFNGSGVNGRLGTSKKNGFTIFLPAAGYRSDADLGSVGNFGNFWSSSLNESDPDYARFLYFVEGIIDCYYYRSYGRSVRAVLR